MDMNKMQEYDKRIGVPEFKGWEQREIEAYEKQRSEKCKHINTEKWGNGIKCIDCGKSF